MEQKIYIRSSAVISPQHTFGHDTLMDIPMTYAGTRLNAIEPDYKSILDPKLIRRMSRIIRMGAAAAMECMTAAGLDKPDAIITGTAYGCLEDTIIFLTKMVEQQEEMLTPTAFIQSTHNTVGAQIAMLLGCQGYNNTFVHRGLSFEQAMLDALLLLEAKEASNVLVGGIDELTDVSHEVLNRFGLYRRNGSSEVLLKEPGKGTMAGEGASFFLLSSEKSAQDIAVLDDLSMFFDPEGEADIQAWIKTVLHRHQLSLEDIDLFVLGNNGDKKNDLGYKELENTINDPSRIIYFKHLCGEYPTSSAFALWLAVQTLSKRRIPFSGVPLPVFSGSPKVMVYNIGHNGHHALMLLSPC